MSSIIYLPSQIHPHYWNPEGLRFYQYILSILFLQGISPDSINSVVPGGWSIANEMNFYFIFPFILKYINKWKWIILIISLSYFIASFVLTNYLWGDMPKYLVKNYFYLFLPNQLNVFLFGILAAYWMKESKIRMGDMIYVIFYLFIVLFSCIYFNDFNHIKTIFVGIFFSLIVYFNVKFSLINFKLLSIIGKMTYTSYLLHFGILMLFSKFLNEYLNFYSAFLLVSISTFFIAFIIKPYTEDMWVDFANKMFQKNL